MEHFLKFIFVFCCFLVTLTYGKMAISSHDITYLRVAMFLTVVSDFFMVLLKFNLVGLIIFCTVQITYMVRYSNFLVAAILLAINTCIFLFVASFFYVNFLTLVATFYGLCFLCNLGLVLVNIFKKKYEFPNNILIPIGVLLFFMCDVNVALLNIPMQFTELNANKIYFLLWSFYLPSQCILSISGLNFKKLFYEVKGV